MEIIWECGCGCGTIIFRNAGQLYFQSLIVPAEPIEFIDRNGFVNGEYSVMPEGLANLEHELSFG